KLRKTGVFEQSFFYQHETFQATDVFSHFRGLWRKIALLSQRLEPAATVRVKRVRQNHGKISPAKARGERDVREFE
ncbi:MAG: hypothetical protein ACRDBL_02925, partial [Rhabdaerophilum sp.]